MGRLVLYRFRLVYRGFVHSTMSAFLTANWIPTDSLAIFVSNSGVASSKVCFESISALTKAPIILWEVRKATPYFRTSIFASSVAPTNPAAALLSTFEETFKLGISFANMLSEAVRLSVDDQSFGVISWKSRL